MTAVIVAGMPPAREKRLRDFVKSNPTALRQGFTLRWFPAGGSRAGLPMARRDGLLKTADQSGAAAILIVSQKPTAESENLRDSIRQYFRCRLLSAKILDYLYPNAANAVERLNATLDEERLWAEKIKPSNVAHPLLLPEDVFLAAAKFRDAWRAAASAASTVQIHDVAVYVKGSVANIVYGVHLERAEWYTGLSRISSGTTEALHTRLRHSRVVGSSRSGYRQDFTTT